MKRTLHHNQVEILTPGLIRAGTIGDQSCFYHSILKCIVPLYQSDTLIVEYHPHATPTQARQILCDNFRRGIARWLNSTALNPVDFTPYTIPQAIRTLNVQNSFRIFNVEAKDPQSFDIGSFDDATYAQLYAQLTSPHPDEVNISRQWILNHAVTKNCPRLDRRYDLQTASLYLDNRYTDASITDLIGKLTSAKLTQSQKIVLLKSMVGNPSMITFGNYPEVIRQHMVGQVNLLGEPCLISFLLDSINPSTKHYYTLAEVNQLLDTDYRKVDREYPINLNYFMIDRGSTIERAEIPDDHGRNTFSFHHIINIIEPKIGRGGIVYRHDAGEDNIISLMPSIIAMNIYLVSVYQDRMEFKHAYRFTPMAPCIVLNHANTHFEVIGTYDNSLTVQTVFEPNHDLICRLDRDQVINL